MAEPAAGSPGPLDGLRVIDITTSYAGPTAAMYLADLGADVVKVERPGTGDDARAWGPPFVAGTSAWFASANRNKRSVVLDLRHPRGLATLRRLVGSADVFLQSMNPGKLEDLGIDHATVREAHPRLIYCAMSGFGLDGPDHTDPGYDLAAQARSGLMSVTGAAGGSPQRVSTALSDVVTGMCAALAVCAAAVRQRSEGVGDLVDVSLLDADLALMAPRIAAYLAGGEEPAPSGGTDSVLALYQTFPTADRDLAIAIGNDAMWRRFCHALDLPELADDPDLADNAGRRRALPRVLEHVGPRLRERTADVWRAVLGASNVPCSPVQRLSEVVTDRQVVARGALMPVPGAEGLHTVHSPFRLGSLPRPIDHGPPALGVHTADVLRQYGFTDPEIAELVAAGAVQDGGHPRAPERDHDGSRTRDREVHR